MCRLTIVRDFNPSSECRERAFLTDCFDGLSEDVSLDMPDIVWFDGA